MKSIIKNNKWKQNHFAYHNMTVHVPWRKVAIITEQLRNENIAIHKAFIYPEKSVLYVKQANNDHITVEQKKQIETLAGNIYYEPKCISNITLPNSTDIWIYNNQHTILEFSCTDRMGLLTDIMNLLVAFPYDIHTGFINTFGPFAHNIFQLHYCNKPLSDKDIEYIFNVFEYEVKERHKNIYLNKSY